MLGGFDLDPTRIIVVCVLLLVAIPVHEASHAAAAYLLGDPTAKRLGRLTLNPISHMDRTGTVLLLMTAIFGFGIGWGKPVPFNPHNLRMNPRTGSAIVSFAGPASNFALAAFLAIALRMHAIPYNDLLLQVVGYTIYMCVVLGVFNLIPLPPLDGFSVVLGILPFRQAASWAKLGNYGFGPLMALVLAGWVLPINPLNLILGPPVNVILQMLLPRGLF